MCNTGRDFRVSRSFAEAGAPERATDRFWCSLLEKRFRGQDRMTKTFRATQVSFSDPFDEIELRARNALFSELFDKLGAVGDHVIQRVFFFHYQQDRHQLWLRHMTRTRKKLDLTSSVLPNIY